MATTKNNEQTALEYIAYQLGTKEDKEQHLENMHSMLLLLAEGELSNQSSIIATYTTLRDLVTKAMSIDN